MMSRLSSRSLFATAMLLILADRSGRGEDVDHEVQRVGPLDARLGVALGAVPVGRRDGEDHPAAHGRAHEGLVPAGDDLAGADREGGGLALAVALVEGLLRAVLLAEVVDRDG